MSALITEIARLHNPWGWGSCHFVPASESGYRRCRRSTLASLLKRVRSTIWLCSHPTNIK
ncbi:hypothetical protein BGX38DRAFT_1148961 [Terfezia claveryi]|nr:hypothetical protein BGX38DRAFT_1148961 [Terfezia claveryi]